MASIIPSVLAVLFCINAASALTCYSCDSSKNTLCQWGMTALTYNTEECGSAGGFVDAVLPPKCYKITAENKKGDAYIARGCLPPGTIGCGAIATLIGWVSSETSDDGESLRNLSCETCDTDKCNSGGKLQGAVFIALILSTITFLI